MTTATETFTNLPMALQQSIAEDWMERYRTGMARGTGIATHYKFLLWVSAEYEISMEDLLSTDM